MYNAIPVRWIRAVHYYAKICLRVPNIKHACPLFRDDRYWIIWVPTRRQTGDLNAGPKGIPKNGGLAVVATVHRTPPAPTRCVFPRPSTNATKNKKKTLFLIILWTSENLVYCCFWFRAGENVFFFRCCCRRHIIFLYFRTYIQLH